METSQLNSLAQSILQETIGGLVLENTRLQAQVRLLTAELKAAKVPDPRDRDSCREV